MVTKLLLGAACFCLVACQSLANDSACGDIEEEYEATVLFLGEADMHTLGRILNQWDLLLKGMNKYAKSDYYYLNDPLLGCDPTVLTINHINGINVLSEQDIKNIFPEYKGYLEKGLLVQTINTRHPCSPDDKNKSVNWFFVFDGEPTILDVSYLLSQ